MNLTKTPCVLGVAAITALVIAFPAQAIVTFNWSAGATCGSSSSVGFIPGGSAFQASLCASTTTERGCGFSTVVRASDMTVAQQNNFRIIALKRGSNYPDPNMAIALPLPITNPPTIADFGATAITSSPTSLPPGENQLLATFTFAAQASATDARYTIYLSPASEFAIDQGDDTCGRSASSGYTAACVADGQATRTASASASPITVNGLRGGVLYTCTVSAANSAGVTGSLSGSLDVVTTPGTNLTSLFLVLLG